MSEEVVVRGIHPLRGLKQVDFKYCKSGALVRVWSHPMLRYAMTNEPRDEQSIPLIGLQIGRYVWVVSPSPSGCCSTPRSSSWKVYCDLEVIQELEAI